MDNSLVQKLYSLFLKYPLVCTDTRNIKPGSIFFALKGDTFNANTFAAKAIESGSAVAVIDEDIYKKDEPYFLVPNVLQTLQQLAAFHRRQLKTKIIGITGSNGKTTTKELIFSVLKKKYSTYATQGNFNNHIGVPLTLLSLNDQHQMAVVEMGANHIGEIAELCNIAQPDYGIITNIGSAHLEGFGGQEGVIKAKSELFQYINQQEGLLFVNCDNPLLMNLSGTNKKITYGEKTSADFKSNFIEADPFVKLSINDNKEQQIIHTQIIGKYNFENIVAAACIGNYFAVDVKNIKAALEEYVPSNSRSQIIKSATNTILLDAYNANPTSMKAAIENFYEMKGSNKILILGDMLELGEHSNEEHKKIITLLQEKGFENSMLIGKEFSRTGNKNTYKNTEEVMKKLSQYPIANSLILIKGSRGIKLETLLNVL